LFCGKTTPQDWKESKTDFIMVTIDLTRFGLTDTPIITSSLHGTNSSRHWLLSGGSQPYDISPESFTIFIKATIEEALRCEYCIHYIGYRNPSSKRI
jgi:hypothetical protein